MIYGLESPSNRWTFLFYCINYDKLFLKFTSKPVNLSITMKKLTLFFIISIAVIASSCQKRNDYTITGKFPDNKHDGDMVFIEAKEGNMVDSAIVSNQSFHFNGIVPDSNALCYVWVKNNYATISFLFLENADIHLTFDSAISKFKTGGGSFNTPLQLLEDSINQLFDNADKLREQREALKSEGKLTPEERKKSIQAENEQLALVENYVCHVFRENATNEFGEYVFDRSYYLFKDIAKLSGLLPLFRESYKQTDEYRKHEERINTGLATAAGKQFVDVKGQDLNGKEIALSDYAGKGKVVLVDFWASWCAPCRAAMPEMREMRKKYKDLEIVGISLDDDKEEWQRVSEYEKIDWPQLSNLASWNDPAAKAYGVALLPHTMLIDKDGTIAGRGLSGDYLDYKLEELLSK